GHSQIREAVMYPNTAGRAGENLSGDDVAGICGVFPPSFLPNVCDHTPVGGLDLDCTEEPTGCGCVAAGSATSHRAGGSLSIWVAGLAIVRWRRRRRTHASTGSRQDRPATCSRD